MPRNITAPRPVPLDDQHITERFVRASGPGGQNVNKVATAVELTFNVRGSSLAPDVQARVLSLAGRRVREDGSIVIDSRAFRTQKQNREAARARLAALIARATTPPRARKRTRPTKAAREERIHAKKKRAAVKALRTRGRNQD
jgi:ribosome-associated protein